MCLSNVFIFEILKSSLSRHHFWTGRPAYLVFQSQFLTALTRVQDSSELSNSENLSFDSGYFCTRALRKASTVSTLLDDRESPNTPPNEGKHRSIYDLRLRKDLLDFSQGSILHFTVEPWHRGRLWKTLSLGWVAGMDLRFVEAKFKLTITARPARPLFWQKEDNFWM